MELNQIKLFLFSSIEQIYFESSQSSYLKKKQTNKTSALKKKQKHLKSPKTMMLGLHFSVNHCINDPKALSGGSTSDQSMVNIVATQSGQNDARIQKQQSSKSRVLHSDTKEPVCV